MARCPGPEGDRGAARDAASGKTQLTAQVTESLQNSTSKVDDAVTPTKSVTYTTNENYALSLNSRLNKKLSSVLNWSMARMAIDCNQLCVALAQAAARSDTPASAASLSECHAHCFACIHCCCTTRLSSTPAWDFTCRGPAQRHNDAGTKANSGRQGHHATRKAKHEAATPIWR